MILNKTQILLVERLEGGQGNGNLKQGWTKTANVITLQKLNEGEQAHKLAEKYPDYFKAYQLNFRLVKLEKLKEV